MADPTNPDLRKVAADSPNRCQAVAASGNQCQLIKVEGSDYCIMHGGATYRRDKGRENIKLFNLAVWQARLEQQKDHPQIKTLNNEVGILRILVENKINACKNDTDLVIHSQGISDLIMKLTALVGAATKLDEQMKRSLNKSQVEVYTAQVIEILARHIPNPEVLEAVAIDLQKAMESL
jgi:hypothetical protein